MDSPVEKTSTRLALLAAAAGAVFVLGFLLGFGLLRSAIAVAMFGAIFWVGARFLGSIVHAPPAEPEVADISDYGLKYVCTMCGLELKIEKAARDRPPTHCMEPMALVREGGRPPLRPL